MALRTPLIVHPHLYIGDSTGRPLDYGMVYFGEPDKDPEFYPIDIFSDEDLTIPIAQPVRTKGGFLSSSGNMAEIHANELIYSVKVLDQYGRDIMYKGQMSRNNVSELLADEVERATDAESTIAASVNTERNRALAAEGILNNKTITLATKDTEIEGLINSIGGGKKAYSTYALMIADAANIPANASVDVTNDTDSTKNGMYAYNGTAFTKSVYDPVAIAAIDATIKADTAISYSNSYTDTRLEKELTPNIQKLSNSNYIAVLLDENGVPVVKLDTDGDMKLTGLKYSVQSEITRTSEKIKPIVSNNVNTVIAVITDSSGIPVVIVKEDGDVLFSGVSKSIKDIAYAVDKVREYEPLANTSYTKKARTYNQVAPFVSEFTGLLSTAKALHDKTSPVPICEAQQDFNIGTAWVNSVTMTTNEISHLEPISGYDPTFREDIGVVHPYVVSFASKVAGYKHWMAITPYTAGNESLEIPFMYGTNNDELRDWVLIEGFPTPFEDDPVDENGSYRGHLSDPAITYDPVNGDLVCFWRKNLYYPDGSTNPIEVGLMARSFDGQKWSEKYTLFGLQAVDTMVLSPSILYNPVDKLFYMYSAHRSLGLFYRTTADIKSNNWSDRVKCTLTGFDEKLIWHFEVKFVGRQAVLLAHVDEQQTIGDSPDGFFFGVSSDFKNFTTSSQSIVTTANSKLYKASFLPIFTGDNNAKFRIVYTTDSQGTLPWFLLNIADTNTINLGV